MIRIKALDVFQPNRFINLLSSDVRNVGRDPTLLASVFLGFITPIGIMFFAQKIDQSAEEAFGLTAFLAYLFPIIVTLPAFLIGWVTGFLFLEDRDDGPLMAVEVSPIGKGGFFLYRAAISAILTAAIVVLSCYLLSSNLDVNFVIFLALLVSSQTICVALLLPILARNKVEGLAATKIINLAAMVPLVALVPSPARYLAGIVPTYWLGELLIPQPQTYLPVAVSIVLAILSHVGWSFILFRIFAKQSSTQ